MNSELDRLEERLEALRRLHAEALERERRYRLLAEDAALGIAIHRGDEVLYMNRACARLLGHGGGAGASGGPGLLEHVAPDDRERVGRVLASHEAGEPAPGSFELELMRRGGDTVSVQSTVSRVEWEGGAALQSTLVDLTTRKEIEGALRWSEQRFKDFSEAAGDWFWETDDEHRFVYLSNRFETVTGLPVSRFIGRRRTEAAGVDAAVEPWASHIADLEARRPFRDFSYSLADRDGRRRHFRVNGLPTFDGDGRFLGYRGTGLEITDRVEARERMLDAERRLSEAMEHIPDGYALFDAEDRLVRCNRTWREALNPGIADIMAPGMPFEQGVRENVRRRRIAEALEDPEAWIAQRLERHRSATGVPFEVRRADEEWNLVREHRTREGGTMIVASDISELKAREQALRQSERRFRDYAETAADYFWETDAEHRTVYLSDRYEATMGFARDALLVTTLPEHLALLGIPAVQTELVERCFAERRAFEGLELEVTTAAGERRVVSVSGRPVEGPDGTFLGFRGTGRDVTKARRLSREIAYQASHDALTGLVNRSEFESRLGRVIEGTRDGDGEHALCYLDLDQFKIINDTSGHLAGDELLRRLSALLREQVRKRDTLARLGGDEFGVLMEHCTLLQARRVADKLRRTVETFRFRWDEKTFGVGVSIGLVPIHGGVRDVGEALRSADAACYVAKDQGRNRIHVYDPEDQELARHQGEMQWATRITEALDADRMRLACQRVDRVGLAGGPPRYEILVRMEDPGGELIPPGAFLPAAERYGLAARVDRWVVGCTLRLLARHPAHLERLDTCSINLSGQSLGNAEFVDFVLERVDAGPVPAAKLCFEITETAAIANIGAAVEFMRVLTERGCRFALDDFGSGLSSFGYLKNLPVHYLKIDGAFVRGLAEDSVDAAMVRSINDIGHAMGKETIAEYVESAAILARIETMGVDYAQGYHVARPVPLESFLAGY